MRTTNRLICYFLALLIAASCARSQGQKNTDTRIEGGKFLPTWESLEQGYRCPDWFRDAKFGIWAHWSAQCVPEAGDWYARHMYIQGMEQYDHHLKTYGHPSESGFMEIDNLWIAEHWDPRKLMELYKRAGAKYFVALANHHDNFDNYDSKYHEWNSVNVGPKKDIVGIWQRTARECGLYFGVSNHSAHAWHWLQTAYGYDGEGQHAGIRYDAATLKKEDGEGKWWEGLDPRNLYTGPTIVVPDGLTSAKEVAEWHEKNTRPWSEEPPARNPEFVTRWFLRCKDLLDSYEPDYIYFDDFGLPLGQTGLDIVAHFYNSSMKARKGNMRVVVTAKDLKGEQNRGVVEDFERGFVDSIRAYPWQTCTCIGDWHYKRSIYDHKNYKSVEQIVQQLIDIVSKNGNLLLSIPIRGDGSIDELEVSFLEELSTWMDVNGEAIFGTRPWTLFGEGPTKMRTGMFNESQIRFTPQDFRFTEKDGVLYAFMMGWPEGKKAVITSLAAGSRLLEGAGITDVSLLGSRQKLSWEQNEDGLEITLPEKVAAPYAVGFRISGTLRK